jgi:hypothetical protein
MKGGDLMEETRGFYFLTVWMAFICGLMMGAFGMAIWVNCLVGHKSFFLW